MLKFYMDMLKYQNNLKKKEKLEKQKATLSQDDLNDLVAVTKGLEARQSEPDSPEALATIPALAIEDIDKKMEELPLVEKTGEVTTLHHPIFTNGIVYVKLLFDSTCVPVEKLSMLSLLDALLCEMDTKNFTYMELTNEINTYLGGIHFSATNYIENGNTSIFYPKFVMSSKALVSQIDKMLELANETMFNTKFDDVERVHEVVKKLRSRMEMNILQSGHSIAYKRVATQMSQAAAYNEFLTGLSFYDYIVELDENFNDRSNTIISELNSMYTSIFNKDGLVVSVTTDDSDYEVVEPAITKFISQLPNEEIKRHSYSFELEEKNEGLVVPGQVQYVCKGANFKKLGYEYSGKFRVMTSIARLDYLWNNVRVKGGAYGAMTSFARGGNMFFVSYRDPNLEDTLSVYDGIGDFFSSIDIDQRELTKYIIGTISQIDQPLTPAAKGGQALSNYISHLSYDQEQSEREDVLNTTVDDIRSFGKMLTELMNDALVCVVGTSEKIDESAKLFDEVKTIIE